MTIKFKQVMEASPYGADSQEEIEAQSDSITSMKIF